MQTASRHLNDQLECTEVASVLQSQYMQTSTFMWPSDQGQYMESVGEWVSMAEQLRPNLPSPNTMQSVGCNGGVLQ